MGLSTYAVASTVKLRGLLEYQRLRSNYTVTIYTAISFDARVGPKGIRCATIDSVDKLQYCAYIRSRQESFIHTRREMIPSLESFSRLHVRTDKWHAEWVPKPADGRTPREWLAYIQDRGKGKREKGTRVRP